MIKDFDTLEAESFDCDVCIIGSGPAGLTIASQLDGTGIRVLVAESGGEGHEDRVEELSAFDNVGHRRAPHMAVRRRMFGGTSVAWTGRAIPFEPLDFQYRDWVPNSGWPIGHEEVDRYLERAGNILGIAPTVAGDRIWKLLGRSCGHDFDRSRLAVEVAQYSLPQPGLPVRPIPMPDDQQVPDLEALQHNASTKATDFGTQYREQLARSSNVEVLLHAHVAKVLHENGRASGAAIQSVRGRTATIRAKIVIVACGGIENARLLLLSRIGKQHDQVGRYLMEHPYVLIPVRNPNRAAALRRLLGHHRFDRNGVRHVYETGSVLSPDVQFGQRLMRGAVHLFERASGPAPVSSMGKILRHLKLGDFGGVRFRDLRNVLRHPVALASGIVDRYRHNRNALPRLDQLNLVASAEQVPNPDSRVTLGDRIDSLGLPCARVDWRIHDLERKTLTALIEALQAEFQRQRLGELAIPEWFYADGDEWRAQMIDTSHPSGTTRMSDEPERGVVDRNCQVHDVENLYVAGSSVFSTGGTSNPTQLIVALALRLSDHVRSRFDRAAVTESAPPTATAVPRNPRPRRVRVAFVGSGDRVERIYRPVMAALADRSEVVGFTCKRAERGREFANATGYSYFRGVDELYAEVRPELVIAAVSPEMNTPVLRGLLSRGVPILAETPLAWNEAEGRGLVEASRRMGVPLGVAEQFPSLPAEQLKRKVRDLGVLGHVVSAMNDFSVYDYHGIACLRSYLGEDRVPVAATCQELQIGASSERWIMGRVRYADGAVLVHHYSGDYFDSSARPEGQLKVFGTRGSIVGDELTAIDPASGESVRSRFRRHVCRSDGFDTLESLFVEVPGLGSVAWSNPYAGHALDDEQIAVAQHVDAMLRAAAYGGWPLYSAEQALEDVEILRAFRYSEFGGGRRVRFPLRTKVEKGRVAAAKVSAKMAQAVARLRR